MPSSSANKSRSSKRRTAVRSHVFQEMVSIAMEQGASIKAGVSTSQAMQETLDRAVSIWRFADDQLNRVQIDVDEETGEAHGFFEELPGPGGSVVVVPNRWWELSREARKDVEKLAGMMTQLGIAERHVRVEEARAVLIISAIKEAALEIGLDNDQVRALGISLREKLDSAAMDSDDQHTPRSAVGLKSGSRSQKRATSKTVASQGPGH